MRFGYPVVLLIKAHQKGPTMKTKRDHSAKRTSTPPTVGTYRDHGPIQERGRSDRGQFRVNRYRTADIPGCLKRADTVAKVENRTAPKISRKLIFRPLYRCSVLQRRYEGPWSIPSRLRARNASAVLKLFARQPKKTFSTLSAITGIACSAFNHAA